MGSVVWKTDRTNAGGGGGRGRTGGRDWLGVGCDPAGERVGCRGACSPGSQEGGRTFRTGPPLGAVERGGWEASLERFSNSSREQLALTT